jgi:uncharacterized membrane protein YGL010W
MSQTELLIYLFFGGLLYLFPWLCAKSRKHNNSAAIGLLNLLLGWSVIAWIVALIWSQTDNVQPQPKHF